MGVLAGGQWRKTGIDSVLAEGTLKRAALGVSQLDHRRRFRSSERARLQGRAGALSGTLDAGIFRNRVMIRRIYVGNQTQFEAMNRAITLHKLRPIIDKIFSFSEAKQAYQHFEARRHFGKVVIAD
jgi:NADPH:quinone reductase-like Zn-dependent oxidoreductase